jgi:hypothetical protein
MEWVVTNSCFNGEDIELRFFDTTNRLVWPPEPGYVYVLPEGETRSQLLSCLTGSRICLGARQELHGFYWGVDINWSQSCAACCYTCSNVSVNFPPLVCL